MEILTEDLIGIGKVLDSTRLLAEVGYRVLIFQKFVDAAAASGGRSRIPISRRIEIYLEHISQPIHDSGAAALTLQMADDRKLWFFMRPEGPVAAYGSLVD